MVTVGVFPTVKIIKKEIARLLADGKEEKARIRVEQVRKPARDKEYTDDCIHVQCVEWSILEIPTRLWTGRRGETLDGGPRLGTVSSADSQGTSEVFQRVEGVVYERRWGLVCRTAEKLTKLTRCVRKSPTDLQTKEETREQRGDHSDQSRLSK